MKMTFKDVLKQYNKYVDEKRKELGIQGSSFLMCSSMWERRKATIKTAKCEVFIVNLNKSANKNDRICGAEYTTTILAGHEEELIRHVESMCLFEFIKWWDVYKDAFIKDRLYDVGGVLDTNE